jgi:hypothetical protein
VTYSSRNVSTNLLVKDRLGLTTITGLLPVITPLSCQKAASLVKDIFSSQIVGYI